MRPSERVTISIPAIDLEFLTSYERRHRLPSRSAAFHEAVSALRERALMEQYMDADSEWYGSGDAAAWDAVTSDGLEDEE